MIDQQLNQRDAPQMARDVTEPIRHMLARILAVIPRSTRSAAAAVTHPRDDVADQHVARREGSRRLTSPDRADARRPPRTANPEDDAAPAMSACSSVRRHRRDALEALEPPRGFGRD